MNKLVWAEDIRRDLSEASVRLAFFPSGWPRLATQLAHALEVFDAERLHIEVLAALGDEDANELWIGLDFRREGLRESIFGQVKPVKHVFEPVCHDVRRSVSKADRENQVEVERGGFQETVRENLLGSLKGRPSFPNSPVVETLETSPGCTVTSVTASCPAGPF